jgi:hypothetical protein
MICSMYDVMFPGSTHKRRFNRRAVMNQAKQEPFELQLYTGLITSGFIIKLNSLSNVSLQWSNLFQIFPVVFRGNKIQKSTVFC